MNKAKETVENNRAPKVQIKNSKTELQEVMAQDISFEDIIDEMSKIILWNYQDNSNGINTKAAWIIDSNDKKIDDVMLLLKYFFSKGDWFNKFLEYIKENDKNFDLSKKITNSKIYHILKKYPYIESLWITDKQYNELIKLLEEKSSV